MIKKNSDHIVLPGLIFIFLLMGLVLFYIAFSTGGLGEN
jgi:hypothetical protein